MAMAEEGRHTAPVYTRVHGHAVLEGFDLAEGHVGAGIAGQAVGEGRPKAPSGMLPPVFPSSSLCSETRKFGWVLCYLSVPQQG